MVSEEAKRRSVEPGDDAKPGVNGQCDRRRIILKRETGNVTLFAFDARQELSEHTTPYDALAQVADGEATITIAGRPYQLRAGDMIIMPAHQPHAVKAVSCFKMLLTMIRS